jgi:hypothetical protein
LTLRRFGASQAANDGSSGSYSSEEDEMDSSDRDFIASSESSNPCDITQYRLVDLSQEKRERLFGRKRLPQLK